jgi:hypothetical protein
MSDLEAKARLAKLAAASMVATQRELATKENFYAAQVAALRQALDDRRSEAIAREIGMGDLRELLRWRKRAEAAEARVRALEAVAPTPA